MCNTYVWQLGHLFLDVLSSCGIRTYHDNLGNYISTKATSMAIVDYVDHISIKIKVSLIELINKRLIKPI